MRHISCVVALPWVVFQSTHPMRGATGPSKGVPREYDISIHAPHEGCDEPIYIRQYTWSTISIHAPQEGCDVIPQAVVGDTYISIHAPHEGCDTAGVYGGRGRYSKFQSTHPMRGATALPGTAAGSAVISIHAPHEGCDSHSFLPSVISLYFNPRTP